MSELIDELRRNANTFNRWDFNYDLLHRAADELAASRAELRKLIIAAKESREVAAIFFRQLNCDQIDCVLEEIAQAGIASAFGTRLRDAIAVAELAAGGEGTK